MNYQDSTRILDKFPPHAILGYSIQATKGWQFMPLYEYRCNQCGEVFEKLVRFSEADRILPCPKCDSQDTHKKLTTIASLNSSSSGSTSSTGSSCGSRGGFS